MKLTSYKSSHFSLASRGPAPVALALALLALPARALRAGAPVAAPHRSNTTLARRIAAISARYRGTPYGRDPLGEGPTGTVDRDPLICATRVDCQTYVEQVLAEAVAGRPDQVLPLLTRIRYRDGIIGFGTRNHYMVADWLPHNRWLIRDDTGAVGGRHVRWMTKVIDRAAFLRARGAPELGRGIPPEQVRSLYIPREAVPEVAANIPDAAVLIWVQSRPGIFAAHCGYAIRQPDGRLLFRHASELCGRVIDESLLSYWRRAPARITGLKVCQAVVPLDRAHRPR